MTRLSQYNEAFWGEEFTGTAGFDVLSRHNSDQKRFLKDFEEYLRIRSRLEHDYSKGLGQLSKSMRERHILGELERAWNTMVGEVESSQQAHEIAGSSLCQQADNIKRLCRELSGRRDTIEDRVKHFHSQKCSQYKTVNSASKTYGQKCREHDQLTSAYQVMDRGVTRPTRDLEKAKAKMEKSEDEANKADVAYKNAVQLLEERRRDWEREMEQACKEFQEKDEEQIHFMRTQMWATMNALSQVALDVDEGCERVRSVLELCDIDEEIQRFVNAYTTGTQRPAPIQYLNYYDTPIPTPSNTSSNSGHSKSPRPPHNQRRSSSSSSSSSPSISHTPVFGRSGKPPSADYRDGDANDSTYSSADHIYSTSDEVAASLSYH